MGTEPCDRVSVVPKSSPSPPLYHQFCLFGITCIACMTCMTGPIKAIYFDLVALALLLGVLTPLFPLLNNRPPNMIT